MAIEQGLHDDFGKKRKYVAVNLADTTHKNRIVSFLKCKNPGTGKMYYDVKAKWTLDKYHPSIMLSKSELLALSAALADMANAKPKTATRKHAKL